MSEHDKLIAEAREWIFADTIDGRPEADVLRRLVDALEAVPAPCNLPSCTNPACAPAPVEVTTVEALDALPELSVVRDSEGRVWEISGISPRLYWPTGHRRLPLSDATVVMLPARVLFCPDTGSSSTLPEIPGFEGTRAALAGLTIRPDSSSTGSES